MGYSGGGIAGPIRASSGYVLSGYEPGHDSIPAVLSKGEAVLVPELVRQLGARRILAANREASGGRPAANVGSLAALMDGTLRAAGTGGGSAAVSSAVGTARGTAQRVMQMVVNLAFSSTMPASTPELRRQIAFVHEELRKYERGKR
jgi:hypothetical protein